MRGYLFVEQNEQHELCLNTQTKLQVSTCAMSSNCAVTTPPYIQATLIKEPRTKDESNDETPAALGMLNENQKWALS